MRLAILAAALMISAPATATAQDMREATAEQAIVIEARSFMESYARDLLTGDRAAIAARYDREGAWMVQAGQTRFISHDAIVRRYAEVWAPPSAFEWRDLVFIPSGDAAVTVVGRFIWTSMGEEPILMSYHGQFVRQDGQLRIRVEDETLIPPEAP